MGMVRPLGRTCSPVLVGYGSAAGRARTFLGRPKLSLFANRASGGLLVVAGMGLGATPER